MLIQQRQTTKLLTDEITSTIRGLNKAADVISSTMGGTGKNVILSNNADEVIFTKDGVSVAKKIRFEDPEENIGAQLLINAANKTVQECGDGTTLTCLLTKEFVNTLFESIQTGKDINDELDAYESVINEKIIPELKQRSQKIDSSNDVFRIANTSSKSSRIAKFLQEIYVKTGLQANISVELSRVSDSTYYEISEGLYFEGGLLHQGFANQDNGTCVFENPFFIIRDENIQHPDDYKEILEELLQKNTPVVFIAPSYSDAFIRYCLTNKQRAGLQINLLRSPGYARGQMENIKDIKTFINDGTANRIVVTPYDFTIYNQVDKNKLKKRVEQLHKLSESAVEDYDANDYIERIHRLQQSSAIIYVGGVTEKNAKEEFDRIEDAVGAVRSALKLGYVRGAGIELSDIPVPIEPLKNILRKPYHKILLNANISPEDYIFQNIPKIPINVRTMKEDENIIDPTYVLISAIENSFALAKLLVNTSFIVYNE